MKSQITSVLAVSFILCGSLASAIEPKNVQDFIQADLIVKSNELGCHFVESQMVQLIDKAKDAPYDTNLICEVRIAIFKQALSLPEEATLKGAIMTGTEFFGSHVGRQSISFIIGTNEGVGVALQKARNGEYEFQLVYQGVAPK